MVATDRPRQLRVLVADLPPIVHEIVVRALSGKADIELVVRDPGREAAAAVAEWCPDVVVVPLAEEGPAAAYYAALPQFRTVRLVEIGGNPPKAYEVRLLAVNPGDAEVVEAIRATAERAR